MKSMKCGKIFFAFFFLIFSSVSSWAVSCKDGSGKDLDGNIVVVSIFADDVYTTWGKDRVNTYALDVMNYMDVATAWIKSSVKKYGAKPNFIYNFFENGGIYYKAKFDVDLTDWNVNDAAVWKYIDEKVNLNWIKVNFNTDNIFFMVYVNTPRSNPVPPAARSFYEGMKRPYEIVYVYRYRDKNETPPSIYAHEMLHIFGAKDLYYADSRNGFTQEFVDYCAKNHKNDIMYTISDMKLGGVHYHKITNILSDLDAYYLGLKKYCPEVDRFKLNKCEHNH